MTNEIIVGKIALSYIFALKVFYSFTLKLILFNAHYLPFNNVITDDVEGPNVSIDDIRLDLAKLLKEPQGNDTDKHVDPMSSDSFRTESTVSTDDVTGNNDRPISLSMKINNDDGNDHESEISRSTSSGK
jgi:hypothetical protein